mgnify:CR=1 FL=1
MKNYQICHNADHIQIINTKNNKVVREISLSESPRLVGGDTSLIIEELFFSNWAPYEVLYEVARIIQEYFPENRINWYKTFLPIEHWRMQELCYGKKTSDSQWYRLEDDETMERKMKERINKYLQEYCVI